VPRRVVRNEADAGQATTDHCDGAAAFVLALWACGAGAGVSVPQGAPVSVPAQTQAPRTDGAPKVRGVSFGTVQKRGWR
jgi:hypothetical protein